MFILVHSADQIEEIGRSRVRGGGNEGNDSICGRVVETLLESDRFFFHFYLCVFWLPKIAVIFGVGFTELLHQSQTIALSPCRELRIGNGRVGVRSLLQSLT